MRRVLLIAFAFILAVPVYAQRINLDFANLADTADEVVDVTLDGPMLRMASKFLSSRDSDQRALRAMVEKLDGIYVRSFTFKKDDAYDKALVSRVRNQLGKNWQRIVTVKSKDGENVEVYTDMRGDAVAGLVVISAEPRELTVVNIVGPIDLEKLADLGGQFGIPRVEVEERKKQ
jgi:hypothetical protein